MQENPIGPLASPFIVNPESFVTQGAQRLSSFAKAHLVTLEKGFDRLHNISLPNLQEVESVVQKKIMPVVGFHVRHKLDSVLQKNPAKSYMNENSQENLKENLVRLSDPRRLSQVGIGLVKCLADVVDIKMGSGSFQDGENRIALTDKQAVDAYRNKAVARIAENVGKLLSKPNEQGKLEICFFSYGHLVQIMGRVAKFFGAKTVGIKPEWGDKKKLGSTEAQLESVTKQMKQWLPPETANLFASFLEANKSDPSVKKMLETLTTIGDIENKDFLLVFFLDKCTKICVDVCNDENFSSIDSLQKKLSETASHVKENITLKFQSLVSPLFIQASPTSQTPEAANFSNLRERLLAETSAFGNRVTEHHPEAVKLTKLFFAHAFTHQVAKKTHIPPHLVQKGLDKLREGVKVISERMKQAKEPSKEVAVKEQGEVAPPNIASDKADRFKELKSTIEKKVIHAMDFHVRNQLDALFEKNPVKFLLSKACQDNLKENLAKLSDPKRLSQIGIGFVKHLADIVDIKAGSGSFQDGEKRIALTDKKAVDEYRTRAVARIAENVGKLLSKRGEKGKLEIRSFSYGQLVQTVGVVAKFFGVKAKWGNKKKTETTDTQILTLTEQMKKYLPSDTADLFTSFLEANKSDPSVKKILEAMTSVGDVENKDFLALFLVDKFTQTCVDVCNDEELSSADSLPKKLSETAQHVQEKITVQFQSLIFPFLAGLDERPSVEDVENIPKPHEKLLEKTSAFRDKVEEYYPKETKLTKLFFTHALTYKIAKKLDISKDQVQRGLEKISDEVSQIAEQIKQEDRPLKEIALDELGGLINLNAPSRFAAVNKVKLVAQGLINEMGEHFRAIRQSEDFGQAVDASVSMFCAIESKPFISSHFFGLLGPKYAKLPPGVLSNLVKNLAVIAQKENREKLGNTFLASFSQLIAAHKGKTEKLVTPLTHAEVDLSSDASKEEYKKIALERILKNTAKLLSQKDGSNHFQVADWLQTTTELWTATGMLEKTSDERIKAFAERLAYLKGKEKGSMTGPESAQHLLQMIVAMGPPILQSLGLPEEMKAFLEEYESEPKVQSFLEAIGEGDNLILSVGSSIETLSVFSLFLLDSLVAEMTSLS